jgi:hypothetical protein
VRGARGWIIAGVLTIALAAVVLFNQQSTPSSNHSSNSDAADGTSALLLYASSLGHPTNQVTGSFNLPDSGGLMFVFTPTSPFSSDDAAATVGWVRSGGVLVYADEAAAQPGNAGDPELDAALGVNRQQVLVSGSSMTVDAPLLDGVGELQGGDYVQPFTLGRDQVALLRIGPYPVGYEQQIGAGLAVVLGDPLPLGNGYLDKADNGRFAADLLGLVDTSAPVAFDEYHHGVTASDLTVQAWLLTPWGAALLWLLVAVFFGLVMRGRRFGPLMPRRTAAARAEAEWAVAVGELLRRSGARSVTLGVLSAASERAVAARTGLAVHPRERFWHALWQRAPEVATELDSAERALWGSSGSERDLLNAAQRLHRIAYPVSEERRRSRPQ